MLWPHRLAHVARAGAGVVGADAVAREAAEELGDRLAGDLAEQVPQRDVEGGVAAEFGAGRAEADIGDEVAGDAIDGERIAAEHLRRDHLMDVGLDGRGGEERLAEADQPSSVWTRTQMRLANSSGRMVSIAVIFMAPSPSQSTAASHHRTGRRASAR